MENLSLNFGIIPDRMVMDPAITHVCIRVYAYISIKNHLNQLTITDGDIVDALRISIPQISRSIRALRDGGYIIVSRVKNARKLEISTFGGLCIITDGDKATWIPVALAKFYEMWGKK